MVASPQPILDGSSQLPPGTFLNKSSPRNHLYRTGRPLAEDRPFFAAILHADLDHLGNFTNNLHLEEN
jgi:hypothetical protein